MATDSGVLFYWKAPASQFAQRIVLASIASLTIHILCFYIFQVQEPQARRTLPVTFNVVCLQPDHEPSKIRLRQLKDYHAAYASALLVGSSLEMPPPRLDYEPTYKEAKIDLMPLPDMEPSRVQPSQVLAVSPLMLPAIPEWTPPEGAVAQAQETSGDLSLTEDMVLTLPQVWQARLKNRNGADWASLRASLGQESGRSSWHVAIDDSGNLSQIFPLVELPRAEVKAALQTLTFSPSQGNQTTWLKMHLEWGPNASGGNRTNEAQ